jgi:hypothetical protein
MHTTSQDRATRERPQSFRRAPRRPGQELRDMLHDVIKDPTAPKGQRTPEHTGWRWHDLRRDDPRTDVPSGDEDAMLAAAIREGCTTRGKVVVYFLKRLERTLGFFGSPMPVDEVLYPQFAKENADMVEAQCIARALPTPENKQRAVMETREAVSIAELACAEMEGLRRDFMLPMGATPR